LKKVAREAVGLPEKAIILLFDLVIDGAAKDEVLLYLSLLKMAKLVYPFGPCDIMFGFDSKLM